MSLDETLKTGSTGVLIEKIVERLDVSELNKAEFLEGRAIVLIGAIARVLVFLRDHGNFELNTESFVFHLDLDRLRELCFGVQHRGPMFDTVCRPLGAYLAQVTEECHRFMAAQVVRAVCNKQ